MESISQYIDQLQKQGQYTFTLEDIFKLPHRSKQNTKIALHRLLQKKRIIKPAQGFYAIVPIEYKSTGVVPPSWYIDPLMQYLNAPYYVGLLTAASLHGASHQASMQFQVVSQKQIRASKKLGIYYQIKKNTLDIPSIEKTTQTGTMLISSPEATAFDLVMYMEVCGHIHNVATVLIELAEVIRQDKVKDLVHVYPITVCQRLGYILDFIEEHSIAKALYEALPKKKNKTHLIPSHSQQDGELDQKWRIIINERIDPDL
ncbi:type IV toxin-antitoxin system AbiEi family antitoxin [bacterium]|nr:type IV toxin-antitoxin system AbiEi family antitoxin [bacterium]